jgi:hypothetical protein
VSPAGATTVRTLDGPSLATRSAPVAGALFLGAASFTFGAILVHLHPALYWADGYGRTVGRDHILLDRWLPLLQVVVYGTGKLTRNVETLRLVLAFIGAFTVASAVALGASLARYSVGVVFALLLATNLLFVALSIVPYQEVLFAGLLFAALSLHTSPAGTRSPWLAAAAFNLACLTRYEGWVLVLVLGLDDFVEVARHDGLARGLRSSLGLTVRYGLAAVGWLLLLRALGGGVGRLSGAPSNDPAGLVLRGREFLRECDWQVGNPLLVATAALGLIASLARRERRRHLIIVACVAFTLLARPYSRGNLRQTFLPIVFALLYAAIGLELLVDRAFAVARVHPRRTPAGVVTVLAAGLLALESIPGAVRFVAASSDEFRDPYEVGRWFERLPEAERSLVHVALLAPESTDGMVMALYSGVPESRFVTADAVLARGTTHVVRIARPGGAPRPEDTKQASDLDDRFGPGPPIDAGSAVIWTIPADAP